MSIVNWTTDNIDFEELDLSPDSTMMVLQMTPKELENRWQGALIIRPLAKGPKVKVEIKKGDIYIKVFDLRHFGNAPSSLVHMTLSQQVDLSADALAEMNLAIAEAIAVYRLPAHWVALNKRLEKKGQLRHVGGKFAKETI
jgi:hypothetical protein